MNVDRHNAPAAQHHRAIERLGEARRLEALGERRARTGRHERAATAFARALRRGRRAPELYVKLGNALTRGGRPRLALAVYGAAIRRAPDCRCALRNRGMLLLRLGRDEEAGRMLRRVVAVAPRDPRARFEIGLLCYRQGRLREAVAHFERAAALAPGWGRVWLQMGHALKLMGEAGRALDAYGRAAVRRPRDAAPHYGRAVILNALGRRPEARDSLARAVAADSSDAAARHMYDALRGRTPAAAPRGYVQRLFDRYALRFDRQMCGPLAYRVPERVAAVLGARRGGRRVYRNTVDLGCGTGLCGVSLRPWARRLTGVDLSPRMLAAARRKGVYDRLVRGDLTAFLDRSRERFDLVLAADVFIYLGDLQPVFSAARRRIPPNGRFIFSTERTRHAPYRLRSTGRFAHHTEYLGRLAAATGFDIAVRRRMVLRKEQDRWVHGEFFVLRRA